MSITPSPVPGSEKQLAAEPTPASPASSSPAKSSYLPLIAVAVVMVLGLGGLFLYTKSLSDRLNQAQLSLQASLSSQSQSLEQITRRLDQTDTRQDRQGAIDSPLRLAGHETAGDGTRQDGASSRRRRND